MWSIYFINEYLKIQFEVYNVLFFRLVFTKKKYRKRSSTGIGVGMVCLPLSISRSCVPIRILDIALYDKPTAYIFTNIC